MAEPESILQLGIEAARDGKKEEARELFRLLTRQEPTNAQGWLWLAGVAENREERQSALEHVVAIEPTNEMALKGLQALGVTPHPATPPPSPPEPVVVPPPAPALRDDDPFGDDDPFAELNNLSDAMAADTSGPVRRTEVTAEDADDRDAAAVAAAAAAGAATGAAVASSRRNNPPPPRSSSRKSDRRSAAPPPPDDEYEPRRGLSPLLGLLLFLVGLGLIGLLIAWLFPGIFGGDNDRVAVQQTSAALTAQAQPPLVTIEPSPAPTAPTDPNATPDPGAPTDPSAPTPPSTPTDPGAPTDPGTPTEPTPQPPIDVSGANPAIVAANTPLESEGWLYDFNQPTFAASIIGNLGQFSPNNGRFVVVLAFAVNNTGQEQAIPANFFVLKDAQGRVWEARPEVSAAYVVPGVNADLSHTQSMPPDGLTRSVAIIFDVAPDATNLVFFARSNPSQGWIVLRSV